ncbi:unnamed protein product [Cochlearia groenlandica]
MSTNHHNQIIEHIVLFKVKKDVDPNKINAMVNDLKGLATVDKVLYLFAGPIHHLKSTIAFTHVLHSRYRSKEDLNAYLAHLDHVRVVDEWLPIWEDFMAIDWVADSLPRTITPCHGSVGRATLLKVKENVDDVAKTEIMEVGKELSKSRGVDHMTMGDNFCLVHTKGFSFASIAYFKDLGEMEGRDEVVNEKVGGYVDDTIVVEFVV